MFSGIVFLFASLQFVVCLLIVFTGLFVFLNIKGSIIDMENKTIKSYWNFAGLKIGP